MAEKMSLASKLARIGKEIGAVDKSGRNAQQNYNYIEYGVVAGKIRELFDQYSVIIIPSVDSYQVDEIENKYGNRGYHYTIKMSFTLVNGDDPDDIKTAQWLGEASDYGDKGINKAETSGTKYFLMRLFNVSEKGETEADSETPEIARIIRPAKSEDKVSESEYTADEIEEAKAKLRACEDLTKLKSTFITLGRIRKCSEIVELKNELKDKFVASDPEVALGEAKDKIDAHFGGDK